MEILHFIDDAVLPNITAARNEHNANLPAAPDAAPGALNPAAIANDEAFLQHLLNEQVRGFVKKHGLLPPAPPAPDPNAVPAIVTRKQGFKALARADSVGLAEPILEADVLVLIDALPETTAQERLFKSDMQIEFRQALTWRRGNPFFEAMVAALGISAEQRDALLRLAGTFLD